MNRASSPREALYQQVWSGSIFRGASRIGVSSRELRRICARHDIPVPPLGWWAKKQHGDPVRQSPLPQLQDARLERILLHPVAWQPQDANPIELLREDDPAWRIQVPEDLQISHPLVKRAALAIRSAGRAQSKDRAEPWNKSH
jgi:hypothetical protein